MFEIVKQTECVIISRFMSSQSEVCKSEDFICIVQSYKYRYIKYNYNSNKIYL